MSGPSSASSIVRPRGRFLRSAQLERDFRDPAALDGYVPTPRVLDHLQRIASALRPESGDRAFRILGAYGSGKSTFALVLAHWLRGHLKDLPQHLHRPLRYSEYGLTTPPRMFPLLVTGARLPLPIVLRNSIARDLERRGTAKRRAGKLERLAKRDNLSGAEALQLLSLYRERLAGDGDGEGLLLVIDELGKVLEYAAQHPEESDVFLWQLLAEEAARHCRNPFLIVGILHEGFSSYAHSLGISQEREWEKVAGRYRELPFRHSLDQTVRILAAALNVDRRKLSQPVRRKLSARMKAACRHGWYGPKADARELAEQAPGIYPLDPYLVPVLDRFFHLYAQNERSIFSFLFGGEPGGMLDHLSTSASIYSLDHFFDYIRDNFDHVLCDRPETNTWVMIKSLVSAAETASQPTDSLLKTVAALNLLNASDLLPTKETLVAAALEATQPETARCIDNLQSQEGKRVLFDRGAAGGLCLWPHVSVDLHAAYDRAASSIQAVHDPVDYIQSYVQEQTIVARKHYIQTGTLRYFRVLYCTVPELELMSGRCPQVSPADGVLLVPLLSSKQDRKKALMLATQFRDATECVVAVPSQPVDSLTALMREALIWEHILTNTPELNNDPYARDTVAVRRERESTRLAHAVQRMVGLGRYYDQSDIRLVWKGEEVKGIKSSREFAGFLTTVFDDAYDLAPRVQNELLNREDLSSAAAAARMRLIEALLERPEEAHLGMDASKHPPEMSMYLSILAAGRLHRPKKGTSLYKVALPSTRVDAPRLNLCPVMTGLHDWLKTQSDKRVPVPEVFGFLRGNRFGVKSGLAPLLLALEAVLHQSEIAFYEDDRFVSQLTGAEIQRLLKNPDTFEIQYCNVKGVRADVFNQLAKILGVDTQAKDGSLLDVVRPLCTFTAQLPPYVLKTKRLAPVTTAVRDALLDAREPVTLLFTDLPKACGVEPIKPGSQNTASVAPLTAGLQSSIAELRACYYQLRQRLHATLAMNFNASPHSDWRQAVMARADALLKVVGDPKLKAFCFRLSDENLSDEEWSESIASLIVSKPPNQWVDGDESRFEFDLGELVGKFLRAEAAAFSHGGQTRDNTVRICLTHPNGEERAQVLSSDPGTRASVDRLRQQIEEAIADEGTAGLMAISDVLWKKLKE